MHEHQEVHHFLSSTWLLWQYTHRGKRALAHIHTQQITRTHTSLIPYPPTWPPPSLPSSELAWRSSSASKFSRAMPSSSLPRKLQHDGARGQRMQGVRRPLLFKIKKQSEGQHRTMLLKQCIARCEWSVGRSGKILFHGSTT